MLTYSAAALSLSFSLYVQSTADVKEGGGGGCSTTAVNRIGSMW